MTSGATAENADVVGMPLLPRIVGRDALQEVIRLGLPQVAVATIAASTPEVPVGVATVVDAGPATRLGRPQIVEGARPLVIEASRILGPAVTLRAVARGLRAAPPRLEGPRVAAPLASLLVEAIPTRGGAVVAPRGLRTQIPSPVTPSRSPFDVPPLSVMAGPGSPDVLRLATSTIQTAIGAPPSGTARAPSLRRRQTPVALPAIAGLPHVGEACLPEALPIRLATGAAYRRASGVPLGGATIEGGPPEASREEAPPSLRPEVLPYAPPKRIGQPRAVLRAPSLGAPDVPTVVAAGLIRGAIPSPVPAALLIAGVAVPSARRAALQTNALARGVVEVTSTVVVLPQTSEARLLVVVTVRPRAPLRASTSGELHYLLVVI